MKNISIKQIIIVVLIFFFLFGDFFRVKKKLQHLLKQILTFIFKNDRKKGT